MTEKFQHLIPSEQESLLNYLFIEYLFDGTLGMWNTAPMELELKGGANTVCSQPYPVPRVHEATCRKEVERLLKIGVLKESNDSEWGAPSFSQPKSKTKRIRFLSDFRNLNRQLKRKPYPMPKFCKMLLNLEGFQYATSLDLNMGCYYISVSTRLVIYLLLSFHGESMIINA